MMKNKKIVGFGLVAVLMFCLFTFFTPYVNAAVLFSDGFESGDTSAWTGVLNTPTVQAVTKYNGSFALYAGSARDFVYYYPVPQEPDCFVGAFIYRDSTPNMDAQILAIYDAAFSYKVTAFINASNILHMRTPSGNYSTGLIFMLDTWYYIQLERKVGAGTGEARLWANGTSLLNKTSETITGNAFEVDVGLSSNNGEFDSYYDAATVSTTYIDYSYTLTTATEDPPYVSENLADIPEDWWIDRTGQYLVTNVTHDGVNAILLNATTTGSDNPDRECDVHGFAISPGDHLYFSTWINITETGMPVAYGGARIGIDFYDSHRITAIQFNPEGTTPTEYQMNNQDDYYFWTDWGTVGWNQMIIDVIVPQYMPSDGGYYPDEELHTPSYCIAWAQVWDNNGPVNPGQAWFSEPYLYLNPEVEDTVYQITASNDANSVIAPSGVVNATYMGNQNFTFSANEGYNISSVLVDSVSVSTVSPYVFSGIAANHTISVFSTLYVAPTSVPTATPAPTPTPANFSVTIVTPANRTYVTSTIPIEVTFGSNISSVWYNFYNRSSWLYGVNQSYTGATSIANFTSDSYIFYVYGLDTFGNMTSVTSYFTVAISAELVLPQVNLDYLWFFLFEGDFLGALQAYLVATFLNFETAIVAILMLFIIPLYIRTKSLMLISIIWILVGGFFVLSVPAASGLSVIFIVFGIAGLLYRLFRPGYGS